MDGRFFSRLVLAGSLLGALAPSGGEVQGSAAGETLLRVDAPGLSELLARGLGDPVVARALGSDLGALVREATGNEPEAWLATLDAWVGLPIQGTLAELTCAGVTLEVWRAGDEIAWGLVARGEDGALALETLERVLALAVDGEARPAPEPFAGARAWRLAELCIGLHGATLGAASDAGALARILAQGPRTSALAADTRGAERAPLVEAWIDLAALSPIEDEDGFATGIAKLAGDPGAQFLLGAQVAALGQARALELRLDWARDSLELSVAGVGVDWGAAQTLAPRDAAPPPAPLELTDGLASAVVHRNLAALFTQRATLFEPRAASGFAKGIADLALFFGGADVSEEILPHVSPWLRVVAAEPAFDPALAPEIPLPGAALVLELSDAERLGPRFAAAFQSLIGILNVERAQQGGEPLVLELELVGTQTMTWAHFLAPDPEDGIDLRHNLAPACVQSGRHLVLATHRDLARRMAQLLAAEPSAQPEPRAAREELRIHGAALLRSLERNRAAIVARAVLVDGKTEVQAEREWRALAAALGLVESLTIEVASPSAERVEAELRLALSAGSTQDPGARAERTGR